MGYTREYFLSELNEFRKAFGTRDFWVGDRPALAVKALVIVFVNTDGLDDAAKIHMEAALWEYDKRLMLALRHDIYKPDNGESEGCAAKVLDQPEG